MTARRTAFAVSVGLLVAAFAVLPDPDLLGRVNACRVAAGMAFAAGAGFLAGGASR